MDVCVYVHLLPSPAPSPPVSVNVTVIDSTSLSVSWGVPEFPQGEIEFYQVEYSSQCSSTAHMNTSSNITEAVLSGLSPFTEYRVRVRAFTVEFGDFSVDQTVTTAEDGRLWLDLYVHVCFVCMHACTYIRIYVCISAVCISCNLLPQLCLLLQSSTSQLLLPLVLLLLGNHYHHKME